jgi:hypothetical protein
MSLLDTASLVVTPNGTKAGKLYSVVPSDGAGDLDVTRATTATRVNSSGLIESVASNVPRLDYTNGTCPSILVEPQRTNLFTFSEDFTNGAWNKANVTVTSNSTISPDGNTTADTLSKSISGVDGTVVRTVSATASGYVGSVFIKKDADTSRFPELFVRSSDGTGQNEIYVQLNTSTGATVTRFQTGSASVSTPVLINGYWRISFYALANSNTCRFGIRPAAGTTLGVFNANATGSIIAWGAQLEDGSYATSYIPTTSASVTRNADVISKTGISSLIGQTEGTFFVDAYIDELTDLNAWFLKENATFDTFVFLQRETSGIIAVGYYGSGALQARIETGSSQPIGRYKIAFGYKNNDFVLYINGTQIGTDTSGTVSGLMDYIDLHWTQTGKNKQNTVALWKTRLTNTQLAQLTTI